MRRCCSSATFGRQPSTTATPSASRSSCTTGSQTTTGAQSGTAATSTSPAFRRPRARNSEAVPPDMFDAYFWVDGIEALHAELVERSRSQRACPRLRGADLERAGLDVIEPGRATARGARDDKCHGEVRTFATTGSPCRDLA